MPELADELNFQPAVLFGCTASEIATIITVVPLALLPVLIGVWIMFEFFIAVTVYAVAVALTAFFMMRRLQSVKNGRPKGYYQSRWLAIKRRVWPDGSLINTTKRWDKRRSIQ